MTSYELTHFKKMVRVWQTKSLLFCLRYDPLIVFRRQNHITFIFIKTMSRDLLVQMALLAERKVNHYVIIIIISWRQFHAANCLNLVNFVSQFGQKEKRYGQIEDTSETKRTATLINISNDASSNEQTLTKESLPDAIFLCLKVCNLSGRIVSLFKRTKFVTKRLKTDSS